MGQDKSGPLGLYGLYLSFYGMDKFGGPDVSYTNIDCIGILIINFTLVSPKQTLLQMGKIQPLENHSLSLFFVCSLALQCFLTSFHQKRTLWCFSSICRIESVIKNVKTYQKSCECQKRSNFNFI